MSEPELDTLAGLPFPQQIAAIDRIIQGLQGPPGDQGAARSSGATSAVDLMETLAGFPDHEPLAYALRALVSGGALAAQPLAATLRRLLSSLPDTGVQRLLRGLERGTFPQAALAPVIRAVADTVGDLELERLAAICLMDRWLKNADRSARAAALAAAHDRCRAALAVGEPEGLDDETLLWIPGAAYADLAAFAASHQCGQPWRDRLAAFCASVLAILRTLPRSLSQTNAEEILSRRVYTDPGHFLVELLQNAEDAEAHAFCADIDAEAVSVWHDGIPFDAKDVVGVLSIGQTTKSKEQIGFFGVGFKSVYEICERPQVYSELFTFEIADISIPRPLDRRPATRHPDHGTLLVLPFRQPRVPTHHPEVLYARASAVPPETLLTLSHLRRLEIRCGESRRTVERVDGAQPERVRLEVGRTGETGKAGETETTRNYLVVSERLEPADGHRELSRASETTALVAIALDADGSPTPVPEGAPTIFSHLPTGERSGLRFLVHAHFDLPVDRERLDLDSPWNRWILARVGDLLGQTAERLADQDALLDVLPLAAELSHPAYRALLTPLRERAARLCMLAPAAGAQRLRPPNARVVADAELARALAATPLDPAGRRACAPLDPRRTRVALALGALPFDLADLVALLRETLGEVSDGDAWPTPWLATGIHTVLEALGRDVAAQGDAHRDAHVDALPLEQLSELPLLPSEAGTAWRPRALRRTSAQLRGLYRGVRPFLAAALDDHPTPAQATLLERLALERHGDPELLGDLRDPDFRGKILQAATAARLHEYLAGLPHDHTAALGSLPLFPDTRGEARPLTGRGDSAAWLAPMGPLAAFVAALPVERCVPLVAPALAASLRPYLARLGARTLSLGALLEELEAGRIQLLRGEVTALHGVLDRGHEDLTPRQCGLLARACLFPDRTGQLRPLRGVDPTLLPGDEDIEALATDAPWLAPELRNLRHVDHLGVRPVDVAAVVDALVSGEPSPLLARDDPASLRRVYRYLIARAGQLSPTVVAPLVDAPIWLDSADRARALDQLQLPPEDQDLAALFDALGGRSTIQVAPSPAALDVVARFGFDGSLVSATADTLIAALGHGRGLELAQGPLREELVRALRRAAEVLSPTALAPIRGAALFTAEDGRRLAPGDWSLPAADAAYRASGIVREALGHGSRPLMSSADQDAFGPILDAVELRSADAVALLRALEDDPRLATDAARGAGRSALASVAAALEVAPPEVDVARRLSALPLWPTRDGQLLPGPRVVRTAELRAAFGDGWEELVDASELPSVLLADEPAAIPTEASALAGLAGFRTPSDLVVEGLRRHARPGQPLSDQVPLLARRERLWRILAAVKRDHDLDGMFGLPLMVDADERLVARKLHLLDADALTLTRGTELRERVADPEWAAGAIAVDPALVPALPPTQLLSALWRAVPRAPDGVLAEPADRAALYTWLTRHRDQIAADDEALGVLGRAALFRAADGSHRAPRELLLTKRPGEPELQDLGLEAWQPAAEIPEELRRWLGNVLRLDRHHRKQLTAVLADGHRDAAAQADGARSAAILDVLARLWPADRGDEDERSADEAFKWACRNHKLRRLKVETAAGGFAQITGLHLPRVDQMELLERMLPEPLPCVSDRYEAAPTRDLLLRLGVRPGLARERVLALLEGKGLVEGADASLALARYVAILAVDEPGVEAELGLDTRAWVPDGLGERRAPEQLYWPGAEVQALIGTDPGLFPHPEFFHTVPEEIRLKLPFRRVKDARLEDVLGHLGGRADVALSQRALIWLEARVGRGGLDLSALREVFAASPLLRDETGVARRPSELIGTDAHRWIGDQRRLWLGAQRFPRLARALEIPMEVGPREVTEHLSALGDRLDGVGAEALLGADPAATNRLMACIALLARRNAGAAADLLVPVREPSGALGIRRVTDPSVALPDPGWLAAIARRAMAPVSLVLLDEESRDACLRFLASRGVVRLSGLFTAAKLPTTLPTDVTPAHAAGVRALSAQLERARRVPALAGLCPARLQTRAVETLEVTGRLAGTSVRFAAEAHLDSDRTRLVVLASALDEPMIVAEALVDASPWAIEEREAWTEALATAMEGQDASSLVAELERPGGEGASPKESPAPRPSVTPVQRDRPPPAPSSAEAPAAGDGRRAGLWSRVSTWWRPGKPQPEPDPGPTPEPQGRAERRPAPEQAGRGEAAESPEEHAISFPDHSRWFEPNDAIDSQLREGSSFSRDRAVAPEYGFAFAPRSLPFPHRYAHRCISVRFQRDTQRWMPGRLSPEWSQAARPGEFRVALTGRIPRGESLFPLPLYGRLVSAEGDGVRILRARAGRVLLLAREPTDISCLVELDASPRFDDATGEVPVDVLRELLARTVDDGELPEEALALVETLRGRDAPPLESALAIRRFIQGRYRYDPSYLEDPGVARWLRRVSQGAPNVHLAALHAGADARYLGRGVCYELGVLACELLRRAGIPAGVASGWTWERGSLSDPDHLWAMALLPSDVGPRWVPIDPSTTRDGRPLRVGNRPPGPWSARRPKKRADSPEEPEWSREEPPPRRRGEPGESGPAPAGVGGRRGRSEPAQPQRKKRKPPRPPVAELLRVVHHMAKVAGEDLTAEDLHQRCRELLANPEQARRLLDALNHGKRPEPPRSED